MCIGVPTVILANFNLKKTLELPDVHPIRLILHTEVSGVRLDGGLLSRHHISAIL